MGRETFLAPVEWKEGDWPVVNGDGTLQLEMDVTTLPEVKVAGEPSYEDFSCETLPIHWSYLCNPDSTKYSFSERPGYLRLKASEVNIDDTASPTFVARRQTEYNFSATAEIDFSNLKNGSQAGLTAYAAAHYHYDVEVRARGRKHYIAANIRIDNSDNTVVEIPVKTRKAFLRITGNRNGYILQYSLDGKKYVDLAEMGYRPLSTETIGGFTGVMLGLYAQGTEGSFADFDSYSYEVEL
jgi:alpha-N-arabinofuranosidase